MSPEVAQALRAEHPCGCGAHPGEHCQTPAGAPMPWLHQDRVYRDLFKTPTTSTEGARP